MSAAAADIDPVRDRHGRVKRKLRLSLTDRCNFRCGYCMPDNPTWMAKHELLDADEIQRLAGLFVTELGIDELRLTGGEPLLRPGLAGIIERLNRLRSAGLSRIAMTSNGVLLPRHAAMLAATGIDDINVSLDALDADIFARMTGGRGTPGQVIAGIEAARAAGLGVKINSVVIHGYNEHQIRPLVRWARAERLPLRFIEFMPLEGGGLWRDERVVTEQQILAALAADYSIAPLPRDNAPATYYQLNGDYHLGVIATVSNPFCARCDRLRLTAAGALYSCLFSASGRDLRTPLRAGTTDADLLRCIRGHVWHKQAGYAATGMVERPITMHALGG